MKPFFTITLFVAACIVAAVPSLWAAKPNIVLILADDMGLGDVSCYGTGGLVKTPHLDKLASEGRRFLDAHTPSGVCTPTRYGLLTGRYAWRTRLKSRVLQGYSPPLIAPDRETIASLLRAEGYATGIIGKWHLGLGWQKKDGTSLPDAPGHATPKDIDITRPVTAGPTTVGFDRWFGCSASWDMPPYGWFENDRLPRAAHFVNATKQKGWKTRAGLRDPKVNLTDALPAFAKRAREDVLSFAGGDKPFFLYIPLTAPHSPVVPNKPFQGKTNIGSYGDFVVETDWVVGQVMKAVDDAKIKDNTLFIFTTDNGAAQFSRNTKGGKTHLSSGPYRGRKRDNWEGGHRVPFIARWPGVVEPDTVSSTVLCLTDLTRTLMAAAGGEITRHDVAEDSFSFLSGLKDNAPGTPNPGNSLRREATVHHGSSGEFAIRMGDWVYLHHQGSGGNNYPKDKKGAWTHPGQLYDLRKDPGQTTNLYAKEPERVKAMLAALAKIIREGRSFPGKPQKNDPVEQWKTIQGWAD